MTEDQSKTNVSRRKFGRLATAGVAIPSLVAQAQQAPTPTAPPAGAPNPNTTQQRRGTIPEIPPFQESLSFARKDVPARVQPFAMNQVRVLGGIYKEALEWNRGYMNRLAADRMLHNFR